MQTLCPCGSNNNYLECCGKFHQGQYAATPEQLMRSRYSAYTLGLMDYIQQTMTSPANDDFDPVANQKWATSVLWLGLNIVNSDNHDDTGSVEFVAAFLENDLIQKIHEKSRFEKKDERWYYVEGDHYTNTPHSKSKKISRNDPCPCQNQKKFKHCHGKN